MSTKSETQIKAQFLAALRQGQTVAAAAKSASMSISKLYQLKAEDPSFSTNWDKAIAQARHRHRQTGQQTFLEALREDESVEAAVKCAGVSRQRVHQWAALDPVFAKQWDELTRKRKQAKDQQRETVQQAFIAALQQGISMRKATQQVNLPLPTLDLWRRLYPKFEKTIKRCLKSQPQKTKTLNRQSEG